MEERNAEFPAQTRKCPYCLGEIPEGAQFCKHCGNPLFRKKLLIGRSLGFLVLSLIPALFVTSFADGCTMHREIQAFCRGRYGCEEIVDKHRPRLCELRRKLSFGEWSNFQASIEIGKELEQICTSLGIYPYSQSANDLCFTPLAQLYDLQCESIIRNKGVFWFTWLLLSLLFLWSRGWKRIPLELVQGRGPS